MAPSSYWGFSWHLGSIAGRVFQKDSFLTIMTKLRLCRYFDVHFTRSTVRVDSLPHRKWKDTKQQPGTAGPGNMLGCCLISFHFLWAIHPIRPVYHLIYSWYLKTKLGGLVTSLVIIRVWIAPFQPALKDTINL